MLPNQKIKTGVIGVGLMGQNHARVYNEISDLVAVSDPNENQGKKVAERFGVTWYRDYRDMLSSVEAVTIAVPTLLHREIAENVAAAGIHLLVEKPLAGTVLDAQAIISSAKEANVVLAVGHIERHNPVVKFVKDAFEKGIWGDIVTMSTRRVSRYPSRVRDIGVIYDLAIHDLDIMRYLANSEVKKIYSLGGSMESLENKIDHASIILQFQNNILGYSESSWLTPMKIRELTLTFNKAYVVANYMSQEIEVYHSDITAESVDLYKINQNVNFQKISVEKKEPLKLELLNFINSIEGRDNILVTGNDGLEVVKLAQSVMEELEDNQ